LWVLNSILSDKFQLNKLKKRFRVGYAVKCRAEVYQSCVMVNAGESRERISLASSVCFSL
jgi:hypothetical protein